MKEFANLWALLDKDAAIPSIRSALEGYFRKSSPLDVAWAVYLLLGRQPKRLISQRQLVDTFLASSSIPTWMFEESNAIVGDQCETIALLNDTLQNDCNGFAPTYTHESSPFAKTVPDEFLVNEETDGLWQWMESKLSNLTPLALQERNNILAYWWGILDQQHVGLLNKVLTGSLKTTIPASLLEQVLSTVFDTEPTAIKHRLMGDWQPSEDFYRTLIAKDPTILQISEPYRFDAPAILKLPVQTLGSLADWWLDWDRFGIRIQCIHRNGDVFLWSDTGELLTECFPEIRDLAFRLPEGTVIEGLIIGDTISHHQVKERLGKKPVTQALINRTPVILTATDLLEYHHQDIRSWPLEERKKSLQAVASEIGQPMLLASKLEAGSWGEVVRLYQDSRQQNARGITLKRRTAPYLSTRECEDFWRWEAEPYGINVVLMYAKMDNNQAKPITEYTFGVWHEGQLTPVAKIELNLSADEIRVLDDWIYANTSERFGPIREVAPVHVFRLAFDSVAESRRHKSGLILEAPRVLHWQFGMLAEQADTLAHLHSLMPTGQSAMKQAQTRQKSLLNGLVS